MARNRGSRAHFVRPTPRTKMWIGEGVGATTLTTASQHLISTLSGGALLLRPFTILRTHLTIMYSTDQEAADEVGFASYASLVVTETAAALGITALPNPNVIAGDPEAAWFTVRQLMFDYQFRSGIGAGNVGNIFEIDDRSMRKVGPDDDVVSLCTQVSTSGAELVAMGRQLIQLH